MVGKIAHLTEKGFGFIQSEDYPTNLFFHAKNLSNARFEELKVNDSVSFEDVVSSEKGLSCKKVFLELQ